MARIQSWKQLDPQIPKSNWWVSGRPFYRFASGYVLRLVAMADAFKDNLDSTYNTLKEKFQDKIDIPDSRKYVGFDGYKSAIKDADVVILTTPPGFRPIHFEEAVKQGKHVFMEKPVATDLPGIRRVLAAAAEAKQKLSSVFRMALSEMWYPVRSIGNSGGLYGKTPQTGYDRNGISD
ncbi:hypothetical protein FQR65_LT18365 [Abscondita terminalis]|nr:hypothetical protein FQR65_LT18365 [Abscondita terminalis]